MVQINVNIYHILAPVWVLGMVWCGITYGPTLMRLAACLPLKTWFIDYGGYVIMAAVVMSVQQVLVRLAMGGEIKAEINANVPKAEPSKKMPGPQTWPYYT